MDSDKRQRPNGLPYGFDLSGSDDDHAGVNSTSRAAGERKATPLMTGCGAAGSRCRSGSRLSRALIAIQASGIPRHTCEAGAECQMRDVLPRALSRW